jgi:hypothetical protein
MTIFDWQQHGAGLTKTHHRKTAFGIAAFHTGLLKGKAKNYFLNTAQEKAGMMASTNRFYA